MAVLYRPKAQWQGDPTDDDPYGWFGCTAYAYAMGVDAVSGGAVVPSGGEIRRLTNEAVPSPRDPGLTLEQVDAAGNRFGVDFFLRTDRWEALARDLADHRWCVLSVWYPAMGEHMAQRPGAFGHAMGAMAISGDGQSTLVFDPLRKAPRWVPLSVVRKASEQWGRRLGLAPGDCKWAASAARIPKV